MCVKAGGYRHGSSDPEFFKIEVAGRQILRIGKPPFSLPL